MTKITVTSDNPNILTEDDIQEMGIEEATDDLGPSWEDVEAALEAKRKKHGQVENE
jgi:hypothetical protein